MRDWSVSRARPAGRPNQILGDAGAPHGRDAAPDRSRGRRQAIAARRRAARKTPRPYAETGARAAARRLGGDRPQRGEGRPPDRFGGEARLGRLHRHLRRRSAGERGKASGASRCGADATEPHQIRIPVREGIVGRRLRTAGADSGRRNRLAAGRAAPGGAIGPRRRGRAALTPRRGDFEVGSSGCRPGVEGRASEGRRGAAGRPLGTGPDAHPGRLRPARGPSRGDHDLRLERLDDTPSQADRRGAGFVAARTRRQQDAGCRQRRMLL